MSMHVTLILIGVDIPGSGLLREGRADPGTGQWVFPPAHHAHGLEPTQTERRFDLIELAPFRYDTPTNIAAWAAHLAGLEHRLRLMNAAPGMLTDGGMPEYLFRRTSGVIGILERLIEDGCREAMDTGQESLDENLLDSVAIDLSTGSAATAGRDPHAGEIPTVPHHPVRSTASATRTRAGKARGRNTVFDDQGPAAAGRPGVAGRAGR